MWQGVIKVIKFFFLFLKTFDPQNVYNMLAILLDPCSKSTSCGELCWVWEIIHFAFEYDAKIITLLLTLCQKCYFMINPIQL
jgi:hypothetical protein